MTRPLTKAEHAALRERIRLAESRTSGEIYCVVARTSDTYVFPALAMMLVGISLAGIAVAWWLDRSWVPMSHLGFALAELAAVATAIAVVAIAPPSWRIRTVPRQLRYRRAHDNAVKQFMAHNVHLTAERTGVLIFVSLAERYAEIVADAGINAAVRQEEWNGLVANLIDKAGGDRLFDGMGEAIDAAAILLRKHFPGGATNPNELDDHVIEI